MHPTPKSPLRASVRWLILLALVMVGCSADQSSKTWASGALKGGPRTLVPKVLEFRYAENRAIAFSMFHSVPEKVRVPLIYGLTSLGLAALLSMVWSLRNAALLKLLPLALILAGAAGNLIDRMKLGYVVDFVHVHWQDTWSFPIFNVADSLITVGATLMICLFLFGGHSEQAPPPAQA
jgi:signal peptidase II